MTAFKQFLLENVRRDIPKLCVEFIEESHGLPLYRGSSQKVKNPTIITPRKDRTPVDTPGEIHAAMDDWFEEHYGVRARSAGVFATGNKFTASSYGTPYFVLPIGDFKYFWAEDISFQTINGAVKDTILISDQIRRLQSRTPDELKQNTNEILTKRFKIKTTNLSKAITEFSEITLVCDQYIIVPFDTALDNNLREKYYQSIIE